MSTASIRCFRLRMNRLVVSARRPYSTIQSGHDVLQPTPWHRLGFGKDKDLRMFQRTPEELRLGLLREAKKLNPEENPQDAEKLETLVDAYTLLTKKPTAAARFATHHDASLDSRLHLLVEGGEHAANFNPEHQNLDFSSKSGVETRSFGDYKSAFESATKSASLGDHNASTSSVRNDMPTRGGNIPFTLRLTFDEAMYGCVKVVAFARDVPCRMCRGSGKKDLSAAESRCKRCKGAGKYVLPSATYRVEHSCEHCSGSGKQPPPSCGKCRGTGTSSVSNETLSVDIPPGTISHELRVVHGKGHQGKRGGGAGDLHLTLLVEDHHLFTRIGRDLHIAIPVPLSVALLGGVVSVPTLRGPQQLKVPPGVSNAQVLTMDGLGVPAPAGSETRDGDMKVHAIVIIPNTSQLTGSQRRAIEELCRDEGSDASSFSATSKPVDAAHRALTMDVMAELKSSFGHWLRKASDRL